MKVGTDGVLLGAWAQLPKNSRKVLDAGAGTGLIALQLAQRFPQIEVLAVEKDPAAAGQCRENFKRSPWPDRLRCLQGEFGRYPQGRKDFDALVCNPPYHRRSAVTPSDGRELARTADYLPLSLLFTRSLELLSATGTLSLVWPFEDREVLWTTASDHGLCLQRVTFARGRAEAPWKRVFTQWGREPVPEVARDELTIERDRQVYTEEYIALTREFYLHM